MEAEVALEDEELRMASVRDHPNAVIARQLWESVSKGDATAIVHILAPDIVWQTFGGGELGGLSHGPEEVLDLLARAGELVDTMVLRISDIFASDSGAVIHYAIEANQGPKFLDNQVVLLMKIRDGRVYEVFTVPTGLTEDGAFWRLQ